MSDSLIKAISLSKAPTDIDNLSGSYYIEQYGLEFTIPPYFLSENYYILKNNSDVIPMDEKYEYKPDYVSYDYYGTTNLWFLVMYVNGISSIEQFNKRNLTEILVPRLEVINQLLSKIRPKKEPEDISNLIEKLLIEVG